MAIRARLSAPQPTRSNWQFHDVTAASLPASMLFGGDRRFEAENFLASGFANRMAIQAKKHGWFPLSRLARTWQPNRLKGIQVGPDFGVPFLAATQVFDLRPVARKWLALERTESHEQRVVKHGTILLTCSGSVGRATLSDDSTSDTLISHDLLRIDAVAPNTKGWLYGYLRAPTVRAMMTSAQYGHVIKHLEVSHLDILPVVDVSETDKEVFNQLVNEVIASRDKSHRLTLTAEQLLFNALGPLPDLGNGETGFVGVGQAIFGKGRRLEASYQHPLALAAEMRVQAAPKGNDRLSDLVDRVFVPPRFKHVYGPEGLPYLDSAQILEVAPDIEKFVLSLDAKKRAGYLVEAGTLMLPCSGQLHGVIGRAVLAGHWHEDKVLTNHILRIVPISNAEVRIGYLLAVLAHPMLGRPRVLKGAYGSSVPELSVWDIENLMVPRLSVAAEEAIADAMEEAASLAAHANELEDEIAAKAEQIVRSFIAHADVNG